MATLTTSTAEYREIVQSLLKQYAIQANFAPADIETQLICDTEGDHYQLVTMGWQKHRRIYGCILHIDIKDGKVWIQHNGTERLVAEELVNAGVPKEHIVLGFHSPFMRQFSDFAVN